MSRCVACNKILSKAELMRDYDPITDGLCWDCLGKTFSEYNVVHDMEFSFGDLDLPDSITNNN